MYRNIPDICDILDPPASFYSLGGSGKRLMPSNMSDISNILDPPNTFSFFGGLGGRLMSCNISDIFDVLDHPASFYSVLTFLYHVRFSDAFQKPFGVFVHLDVAPGSDYSHL